MSEPIGIWERVHEIMRELPGVRKKRTNTHGNFKYAGHEDLTEALRPHYLKHKLVRTFSVTSTELTSNGHLGMSVDVIWTCADNPSDRIVVSSYAIGPCTSSKGSPSGQQSGIAISYAVKNAEFKLFALTGDDTPDPESLKPLDDEELEDFIASFEKCRTKADLDKVQARVTDNKGRLGGKADAIRAAYRAAKNRVGA